tara:strand:- start:826 stop:1251 length:426 start_codon:yes stop_codon:yes gene_type:complete
MKNGIGPQNLGATGMSSKSKPCGTPLDFNAGFESLPEGVQRKIDPDGKADSAVNSGTPLYFQDDISKIQEAASTLEAHNIGGGGGEVQGAAAAAQETAASQMGQARRGQISSLFGGMKRSLANASGGLGRMVSRMGARGIV